MGKDTGLEYELFVKWTTELPYVDVPRQSPNICIKQDSGWFLKFTFSTNCGGEYRLHLCNKVNKNSQNAITTVTTHIQDITKYGAPLLRSLTVVYRSDTLLWMCDKKSISAHIHNIIDFGKLSITCLFEGCPVSDAAFIAQKTDVSIQTDSVYQDLKHLSRDFGSLINDKAYSDVKLKCGDCTFSAHKSVLAARSEVFAAMFRNKMAESETGVVNVQDLDPDVLECLLEYVYSGEKPDRCPDIACRLYEAADKYAVYALKKTCSEYMVAELTPENCLDLLVLADEHADEDFKEAVSRFAADHLQLLSGNWSTFKKKHSELAFEVYDKRFADAV